MTSAAMKKSDEEIAEIMVVLEKHGISIKHGVKLADFIDEMLGYAAIHIARNIRSFCRKEEISS